MNINNSNTLATKKNTTNTLQGGIIWCIATLYVVYSFCLNTAAAVFSDAIKTSLNINLYEISIATGAFILGFACLQIPAGYLLDRYDARYVVSFGVLLLGAGNVASSFSNSFVLFTGANFIQGVGASFAFIAAAVLISQWFTKKLFPILFGLVQSVSCISAGLLHYFFTILLNTYNWKEIYLIMAGFGLILLILSLLFIKSPAQFKNKKVISLKLSFSLSFKNKQIMLCSIAAATSFGVLLSYASFWYLNVQQYYLVSKLDAFVISGIIFVGLGIGTPLLAWFSNIIKSRITVLHLSLVLGTMAFLLGLFLPHFNSNNLFIIKTISFFIGFFLSGSMLFYTIVNETATDNYRGVALSILNTFVFLFNTLMMFIPLLFIITPTTLFYNYLWTLPFCVLVSILLLYFIEETYPLSSSSENNQGENYGNK